MGGKHNLRRRSYLGAVGGVAATSTMGVASADNHRLIMIEGAGQTAQYELSVSGELEKSEANGATLNSYDSLLNNGTTVQGRTTNEPDAYEYTGEITDLTTDRPIRVSISDAPVEDETDDTAANILTIEGDSGTVHYEFTVSDAVEKSESNGGTLNDYDEVAGNTVTGRTTREPDSYAFEGEIVAFDADGDVTTTLNGANVSLGQSEATPAETESDEQDQDQNQDQDQGDDSTPSRPEFENEVNVVDAGADPNGNDNILPVLEDAADDNTLLVFPEGEYRIDGTLRETNYDHFGMVGEGATITVEPTDDYVFKLGTYLSPIDDLYVAGFTADISGDDTGGRVFELQAGSNLEARDITIEGTHDTASKGPMLAGIGNSDGEGVVENIDLSDGGEDVSGGNGGTGLLISHYHEGSITVRDVDVGPFPDNGIYCSNSEGEVTVEGGSATNTNVAGVRLDGDTASITGTEFTYDEDIDGYGGQRPIRLDGGDCTVEDVTIDMSISQTEAIRVMPGCESATIRNVTMDLTSAVRDAISVTSGAGSVDIENLDASGYDRYEVFNYS